jgi:anti-anti-sigma regulatory factor
VLSPVIDEKGIVSHLLITITDITDRKQQELQLQEQHEIIMRQHDALNELSTPLLSISDTTVVLPLIGSIDSQRIQLIASLLEGVTNRHAEHVIPNPDRCIQCQEYAFTTHIKKHRKTPARMYGISRISGKFHTSKKRSSTLPKARVENVQRACANKSTGFGMIIDITGVPIVDTQVANALIQATQAVRLLGARVMLSGVRPEVAQTLVGLGVDFGMRACSCGSKLV